MSNFFIEPTTTCRRGDQVIEELSRTDRARILVFQSLRQSSAISIYNSKKLFQHFYREKGLWLLLA